MNYLYHAALVLLFALCLPTSYATGQSAGDTVNINFSDALTPAPAGYLTDHGEAFGQAMAEHTAG